MRQQHKLSKVAVPRTYKNNLGRKINSEGSYQQIRFLKEF